MHTNLSLCCFFLLLLNVVGAKPISDLQSLKQLFEDELNTTAFSSSSEEEERDAEGTRLRADGSMFGAPEQQQQPPPWNSSEQNAAARLLRDFLRTSKRSWSRYKNGGLRSCFGVRLERIGSFSGLGC